MKSLGRWLVSRAALCHKHKTNFWSSIVLIGWGSILVWNSDPINSNFFVALMIFDESHLETMAIVIGCIQLLGVLSGCKWFRIIASGMAAWLLFTLGYSLVAGGAVTPGMAAYIGWGCINLHSMVSVIHPRRNTQNA